MCSSCIAGLWRTQWCLMEYHADVMDGWTAKTCLVLEHLCLSVVSLAKIRRPKVEFSSKFSVCLCFRWNMWVYVLVSYIIVIITFDYIFIYDLLYSRLLWLILFSTNIIPKVYRNQKCIITKLIMKPWRHTKWRRGWDWFLILGSGTRDSWSIGCGKRPKRIRWIEREGEDH